MKTTVGYAMLNKSRLLRWHVNLSSWVTEGARVEIAKDITDGDNFPLAPTDARPFTEVSESLTLTEPLANYNLWRMRRDRSG